MADNLDPRPLDARQAFERFTYRLVGLARQRLTGLPRNKVDPEDVVQSVYKSLLLRYDMEKLAGEDEHGLWSLLARITLRKCADRARYHQADCRDATREAGSAGQEEGEIWAEATSREPTPEEAAVLTEAVERLFGATDAEERAILELSLQGYGTLEISEQLGRAERSVRRARERARARLERMRDEGASN